MENESGKAERNLRRFLTPTILLAPGHSDARITQLNDVTTWLMVRFASRGRKRAQFFAGPVGGDPVLEEQVMFYGEGMTDQELMSEEDQRAAALRNFRHVSENWQQGKREEPWPRGFIVHPVDGRDWIFGFTGVPEYVGETCCMVVATRIDDEDGIPDIELSELEAYRAHHEALHAWRRELVTRVRIPFANEAFGRRYEPWWQ